MIKGKESNECGCLVVFESYCGFIKVSVLLMVSLLSVYRYKRCRGEGNVGRVWI